MKSVAIFSEGFPPLPFLFPYFYLYIFILFETGSRHSGCSGTQYVAKDELEPLILLLPPFVKCWDGRQPRGAQLMQQGKHSIS